MIKKVIEILKKHTTEVDNWHDAVFTDDFEVVAKEISEYFSDELLQEPKLRDQKAREFFLSESNALPNGDLLSFAYGVKKYHDYLEDKINK